MFDCDSVFYSSNPQTFSPQKVKWFAWGSLMSVPIAWCIDALKRINVFVLTVWQGHVRRILK